MQPLPSRSSASHGVSAPTQSREANRRVVELGAAGGDEQESGDEREAHVQASKLAPRV